jgi:hypothetical protein
MGKPPHVPSPRRSPEVRQGALDRLIAILDDAVALQPEADRIVRVCSADGDVPTSLLSDAHRVTTAYADLGERLEPLRHSPAPADVAELATWAQRRVDHHLLLVHGAVNMALPAPPYRRRTDPRAAAQGLGEPGEHLRALLQKARQLLPDDQ